MQTTNRIVQVGSVCLTIRFWRSVITHYQAVLLLEVYHLGSATEEAEKPFKTNGLTG